MLSFSLSGFQLLRCAASTPLFMLSKALNPCSGENEHIIVTDDTVIHAAQARRAFSEAVDAQKPKSAAAETGANDVYVTATALVPFALLI
jgi:hypothetical protein